MRALTLFLLALLLHGCGAAVAVIRVRRNFKKRFECSSAKFHDWDDGARVEGCDVVAYYWCDGEGNSGNYNQHYGRVSRASVVGGAVVGVFKIGVEGETCALDHHYSSRLVLAPDADAGVRDSMAEVDRSYFRAMASFDGGRIELWAPRIHREYTLLKLFSEDPLIGDVSFTRDGSRVEVAAQQQVADTEARFLIPTAQLHGLEGASFAINAFGSSYALDEPTLRKLSKFDQMP